MPVQTLARNRTPLILAVAAVVVLAIAVIVALALK